MLLVKSIRRDSRSGMTLLISVLVLGAVTIVVGAGIAVRGIEEVDVGRSTVQTAEALAAADGCVEVAMLQLKRGVAFTGTTLPIGDGVCHVRVSGSSSSYAVVASGTVLQWTREIRAGITMSGSVIQELIWEEPSSSSSSTDSCNDPLYQCTPYNECTAYLGGLGDACDLSMCCGLTVNTCKVDYTGCPAAAVECREGECYNSGGNPIANKSCVCTKSSYSSSSSSSSVASSSSSAPACLADGQSCANPTDTCCGYCDPLGPDICATCTLPTTGEWCSKDSHCCNGETCVSNVCTAASSSSSLSASSVAPDSCADPLYECTNLADCSAYPGGSGDACDQTVCCGVTVNTCKYFFSGCTGGGVECRDGQCYNNGGNPTGNSCTCTGF